MRVFLLKDIKGLGNRGQIKEVNDGYARNFLLPQKLVVLPQDATTKEVVKEKTELAIEEKKQRELLAQKVAILDGKTFTIQAKADKNGKLYGSITPKEIAKLLDVKEGLIKDHFKSIGKYTITLVFSDENKVNVTIVVTS